MDFDILIQALRSFKGLNACSESRGFAFYKNSVFLLYDDITIEVEYFSRSFNTLLFHEYNSNVTEAAKAREDQVEDIIKRKSLSAKYCETSFIIDKSSVTDFIKHNYNSHAKMKKVMTRITCGPLKMEFIPYKKSTSVSYSALSKIIDYQLLRVDNLMRFGTDEVEVNTLKFYDILKNDLFIMPRVEISGGGDFIRISSKNDNMKIKAMIKCA